MSRACWIIAAVTLALAAVLLFTNLGHYALWDDEAVTALAGRGVWRTGDTSVVLDHNVVAYRSGLLLNGTYERSTPPLGAYIAAPFVGISGSSFAVRLPFALFGLASVGLILGWLYTLKAHGLTWLLVGMALIGNVSFFLYCRQCRYYSPVIFSSILIAWLYTAYDGRRWQLVLMSAAGLVLLAGNYLNYLALHLCLLLDYLIIGRKRRWLKWQEWLIILLPQVILGSFIVLTWNTLRTGNRDYAMGNSLSERLQLIWMNLRDINASEYGVGLLIVLAAGVYFIRRQQSWLWRAPLALLVYVVIVSMLSPQLLNPPPPYADVRYLTPIIPLGIAIGVMVLLEARPIHMAVPIVLAVFCFGTNLLNGSWFTSEIPPRSTLLAFIGELSDPPPEPYTPAIAWIKENVRPMESIWIVPDYMTYPLMYHAPHATYAWQFKELPPAFKDLPEIHINGKVAPQFVMFMGPAQHGVQGLQPTITIANERFELIDVLRVWGKDLYRPELVWHQFAPIPLTEDQVRMGAGIYVFRKIQTGFGLPGFIR